MIQENRSTHVVLLVETGATSGSRGAAQSESAIAAELERAGYEVIQAHSLSMAVALLFVARRITEVVIEAPTIECGEKLALTLSTWYPDLPLVVASIKGVRPRADGTAKCESDKSGETSPLRALLDQLRAGAVA